MDCKTFSDKASKKLREQLDRYSDLSLIKEWVAKNKALVHRLFGNGKSFAAFIKETHGKLKKRLNRYRHIDPAKEWMAKNKALVLRLFENVSVRDFVFVNFYSLMMCANRRIRKNANTNIFGLT